MSFGPFSIHQATEEVVATGCDVSELDVLVVNEDDWLELINASPMFQNGNSGDGDIRVYGVKIVTSRHTERGTILKVFHNDNQMLSKEWTYKRSHIPYVPTMPENDYLLADKVVSSIADAANGMNKFSTSTKQAADAIKKFESATANAFGINNNNETTEHTPDIKKEQEPRHSEIRKVELG
jgi:hypothetical protein